MVNLLLAMTQYSADAGLWRQTVDAIGRLGDRVQPESLIYRDAWGDVARTGHTVRDRLAEHLGRLSALEPWEVMRLAVAAYYVDGLEDVRVTLRRLMERDRDRGAVTNAMTMQHLVLLDLIRSGQWAEAEELGRDGLELTRIHRNELFRYQFTAYLAVLAAGIGDLDVARRNAAEVTAWAGPRRLGLLLGYAQRAAVLVALAEGDYDAAYDAAVRIGAPGEFPPYAYQAVDGLLDMVEAAVHSGHQIEARAHAEAAVRLGWPTYRRGWRRSTTAVARDDGAGRCGGRAVRVRARTPRAGVGALRAGQDPARPWHVAAPPAPHHRVARNAGAGRRGLRVARSAAVGDPSARRAAGRGCDGQTRGGPGGDAQRSGAQDRRAGGRRVTRTNRSPRSCTCRRAPSAHISTGSSRNSASPAVPGWRWRCAHIDADAEPEARSP